MANEDIDIAIRLLWCEKWFAFITQFCGNLQNLNMIDSYHIHANKNLMMEYVEMHPEITWDLSNFSSNPNVIISILHRLFDTFDSYYLGWVMNHLSRNNPDIKMIDEFPDNPWIWRYVCESTNLTMELLLKYKYKPLSMCSISANKMITMQIILDYPDWKMLWDWDEISKNPNITFDDVLNHPEFSWSFKHLTMNKNVTIEMIQNHPEFSWDYDLIFGNPNITMEYVRKNMHNMNDEHWRKLSVNKGVSAQNVLDNPDFSWDVLYGLHVNKNMDYRVMEKYRMDLHFPYTNLHNSPNIPVDWIAQNQPNMIKSVSTNPTLTMDFIQKNRNLPWSPTNIAQNNFDNDRETFITHTWSVLLLAILHEQYNDDKFRLSPIPFMSLERILFDPYLLKNLAYF